MINVKSAVTVYEIDGKETQAVPGTTIEVLSHWNRNTLVVLHVNGAKVTVSASDLRAAVDNATNTGR